MSALRRAALTLLALLAFAAPADAAAVPGVYVQDEDATPQALAIVAATGVRQVRADWRWSALEPERGRLDWRLSDRMVAAAARVGVDVMPTLLGAPPWASGREAGSPGTYPPTDPADFARFAHAAVRRYGPDGRFWAQRSDLPARPIRVWQIWNEPNLPAFWRPRPDPQAYTALLAFGAVAIRWVDPGAEIVLAGLPDSPLGMAPDRYLRALYRARADRAFDTLAVHPYAADPATVVFLAQRVRRIADAHGDPSPMRVTEFGWSSAGLPSLVTGDRRTQARLVGDGVLALRRAAVRLRLKSYTYFKWRDRGRPDGARDTWPHHAGLLLREGRAKPALLAYATAVAAPLGSDRPKGRPAPLGLSLRVPSQRPVGRLLLRAACSRSCRASVVVTAERGSRRRILGRTTRTWPDRRARTVRLTIGAVRRGERLAVRLSALDADARAAALPPRPVVLSR